MKYAHCVMGRPLMMWVAASAAMLAACGKGPETPAATTKPAGPAPVNITTASARTEDLQRSVRITGSLVGLETATISNRVSGRITKIYVDRGDRVKPGAKLLDIEPDRYKMAVDESQASLQQTLARLGIKDVPGEDFDVNQTAPVKKAKSEYDLAKDKMDRSKPLNASKAMNDFEYMDIVSTFKTTESSLESSRDEARALLAQARQFHSQMDMKQKDYSDSVIYAPDGTNPDGITIDNYAITDRKVSPGEYLKEGTAVFTVIADSILKLQAHVPERFLGDVKKDAVVKFRVEAYPNEAFEGKVTIIDPAVDPASRTFMIEAMVDNVKYSSRLRPGSFVPGEVLTKKEPGCVMVPLDAVTSFVGVTKIFKVTPAEGANPPMVKSVEITTGQQEEVKDANGKVTQWVEIAAAKNGTLNAGDQVAISGLTKLVNGSVVTLDKQAADSSEKPADQPTAKASE